MHLIKHDVSTKVLPISEISVFHNFYTHHSILTILNIRGICIETSIETYVQYHNLRVMHLVAFILYICYR